MVCPPIPCVWPLRWAWAGSQVPSPFHLSLKTLWAAVWHPHGSRLEPLCRYLSVSSFKNSISDLRQRSSILKWISTVTGTSFLYRVDICGMVPGTLEGKFNKCSFPFTNTLDCGFRTLMWIFLLMRPRQLFRQKHPDNREIWEDVQFFSLSMFLLTPACLSVTSAVITWNSQLGVPKQSAAASMFTRGHAVGNEASRRP